MRDATRHSAHCVGCLCAANEHTVALAAVATMSSLLFCTLKGCIDCSLLGCAEGRSAAGWVDYNLFGHQIVCHQINGYNASATANAVDGDPVPVPHFGLALSVQQFHDLADRLKQAKVAFVIQPHLRFEGRRMVHLPLSLE